MDYIERLAQALAVSYRRDQVVDFPMSYLSLANDDLVFAQLAAPLIQCGPLEVGDICSYDPINGRRVSIRISSETSNELEPIKFLTPGSPEELIAGLIAQIQDPALSVFAMSVGGLTPEEAERGRKQLYTELTKAFPGRLAGIALIWDTFWVVLLEDLVADEFHTAFLWLPS